MSEDYGITNNSLTYDIDTHWSHMDSLQSHQFNADDTRAEKQSQTPCHN